LKDLAQKVISELILEPSTLPQLAFAKDLRESTHLQ